MENITGDHGNIIVPRALKHRDIQNQRVRDMAEVFTPSWVCNAQNNLVDAAWFGRDNVFNIEVNADDGKHTWMATTEPITEFPEGKTWIDYIRDTRMEITCGEAPYLVSRYDTTTGEFIPLERRIGILDRKLRIVSENCHTSDEWLKKAQDAFKNTYGYEWQGDSLLLARESLLISFIEYYEAKFNVKPNLRSINYIAYIVSWNLWQMDGLKMVVPGSCDEIYDYNLLGIPEKRECPACKKGSATGHIGKSCLIRDWRKAKPKYWVDTAENANEYKPWQKIYFSNLLTINNH